MNERLRQMSVDNLLSRKNNHYRKRNIVGIVLKCGGHRLHPGVTIIMLVTNINKIVTKFKSISPTLPDDLILNLQFENISPCRPLVHSDQFKKITSINSTLKY